MKRKGKKKKGLLFMDEYENENDTIYDNSKKEVQSNL